jgi:hypothetical protein
MGAGSAHLIATFTPGQWTSVFGKRGNYDPAATAGFMEALNHLWSVGLVFGGGCFYGHGVNLTGGTARFALERYSIR